MMHHYRYVILGNDGLSISYEGTIDAYDRDHALLKLGAAHYQLENFGRIFLDSGEVHDGKEETIYRG